MEAKPSIVYLTRPEEVATPVFDRVLSVARGTGAQITVLQARLPPDPWSPGHIPPGPLPASVSWEGRGSGWGVPVGVRTLPDGPLPEAVRRALPPDPILVAKVSRWQERSGRLPGRAADRLLLRGLPCSVWLLSDQGAPRDRVVVAAVELRGETTDPVDRAVLRLGSVVARAEGARLLVVHAWSLIGETIVECPTWGVGPTRSRHLLGRLREEHQTRLQTLLALEEVAPPPECVMRKGVAARVIREALHRTCADVLVAGYRGRTGFWGFLQGNLVEGFLGTPGLSVLVVRASAEGAISFCRGGGAAEGRGAFPFESPPSLEWRGKTCGMAGPRVHDSPGEPRLARSG